MERGEDRSLGDLFSDLSRQTSTLVRQEIALARTEVSHKLSQAGKDAGMIATGTAVAYAGFLALVGAAVLLLAKAVDWWLSALIIGVVVAIIGGIMIKLEIDQLKSTSPVPEQTIETLKEDKEWAKRQVS